MECTAGVVVGSEDLLTQLKTGSGLFINELPVVNHSSLVVNGKFNFSSKS